MIRDSAADLVKVGDTYQVLPPVICLPDLTKRERVKEVRARKVSKPKYTLLPSSVLTLACHLECRRKDTALSYAMAVAAGKLMMKKGEDPLEVVFRVYDSYKKPEKVSLNNIEKHTRFKPSSGWIQQTDGSYIRIKNDGYIEFNKCGYSDRPPEDVQEHTFDNFMKKHHLCDPYMSKEEEESYNTYVKGEVRCG